MDPRPAQHPSNHHQVTHKTPEFDLPFQHGNHLAGMIPPIHKTAE
jgi:hypothetical protein